MSKRRAFWLTVFWAALTLFFFDHLFDIPGLIARHHQGIFAKAFGSWVSWTIGIMMVLISASYTVVYTRAWLQGRSAVDQVR